MGQKKRINNSSKAIFNRSINVIFTVTSILLNYSFKISKIYLTQKIFSWGFTESTKRWVYHLGLEHSFPQDIATENLSLHVLLPVTLFPKNIQSNFILILLFRKTIAIVNYIKKYQLNISLIEESKIASLYRDENSL